MVDTKVYAKLRCNCLAVKSAAPFPMACARELRCNLFRIHLAARLHRVAIALHRLAVDQGFACGQGFVC